MDLARPAVSVRRSLVATLALTLAISGGMIGSTAYGQVDDHPLDPARNTPLPCELVNSTLSLPARSDRNLEHLANRCGIVGTDVEFQSRKDANGKVHDYAFLGTMGAGMRIWDITNPQSPIRAGRYLDPGWQNDVQVRGDIAVISFDLDGNTSTCLAGHEGIDIVRMRYRPAGAADNNSGTPHFTTSRITCIRNEPGGAHNSTIHPSGKWVAISNPSDWAVDVIDLRNGASNAKQIYRLIDVSRQDEPSEKSSKCATTATYDCIVMKRPNGDPAFEPFRPHDVFFSRDGNTMYVAAIQSTFIVNVAKVLAGSVKTISIIPNVRPGTPTHSRYNIEISHQADTSPDGKILVISDERGGGLQNTECTEDENGVIGGLHFYALGQLPGVSKSVGASPSNPKKLGVYFNPNPGLEVELADIQAFLATRLERGCTAHVFRIGGNGTASPGPIDARYDGVSRLWGRLLAEAWYGAGVWYINFAGPKNNNDGIVEDKYTTWGNTWGWNVQYGADTWSAKEYKGFIYAGDMLRGFDVYSCYNGRACDPAVWLTKTGPAAAKRGSTVTFEISYRNAGPAASQNAKITDKLPSQLVFVSASNGGSYNATTGTVTWSLGSVSAGSSGSVILKAKVRSTAAVGTGIVNQADFTGDNTVSPNTAVTVTWVTP